jgi:hypothetical protein
LFLSFCVCFFLSLFLCFFLSFFLPFLLRMCSVYVLPVCPSVFVFPSGFLTLQSVRFIPLLWIFWCYDRNFVIWMILINHWFFMHQRWFHGSISREVCADLMKGFVWMFVWCVSGMTVSLCIDGCCVAACVVDNALFIFFLSFFELC